MRRLLAIAILLAIGASAETPPTKAALIYSRETGRLLAVVYPDSDWDLVWTKLRPCEEMVIVKRDDEHSHPSLSRVQLWQLGLSIFTGKTPGEGEEPCAN